MKHLFMWGRSTWSQGEKQNSCWSVKLVVSNDSSYASWRKLCWMLEENTSRSREILKHALLRFPLPPRTCLERIEPQSGWKVSFAFALLFIGNQKQKNWDIIKSRVWCKIRHKHVHLKSLTLCKYERERKALRKVNMKGKRITLLFQASCQWPLLYWGR